MTPAFSITERKGKLALWVNGQNIWELDKKEVTYAVKQALISAYYIGACQMREEIRAITIEERYNVEFALPNPEVLG